MVLDIEKYPEFVPWCLNGLIHSKNEKGDPELEERQKLLDDYKFQIANLKKKLQNDKEDKEKKTN